MPCITWQYKSVSSQYVLPCDTLSHTIIWDALRDQKIDLTVSLTVPVIEWLDSKLEAGDIANKSFFINQVLLEEMEQERERAKSKH